MHELVDPELFFIDQIHEVQIIAGHDECIQDIERNPDFQVTVILHKWGKSIGDETNRLETEDDDQEFIDGPDVPLSKVAVNAEQTYKSHHTCRQEQNILHAAINEELMLDDSRRFPILRNSFPENLKWFFFIY
jgi:hypothetical protein